MSTLVTVLWLYFLSASADASNILLFLAGTSAFERQTVELLAQQLARRHHNTITVKPILIPEEPRLVQPRLHFVTERVLRDLLPKRLYEPLEFVRSDVPWRDEYSIDGFAEPYWEARVYACKKILNSNLMEVLAKDRLDVAVVYGGDPCQLGVIQVLGLPFVYIDLEGLSDETRLAAGAEWQLAAAGDGSMRLTRFAELFCQFVAEMEPPVGVSAWLPCGRRVERLDAPISRLFAEDYAIRQKFSHFPTTNEIKRSAEVYLANMDEFLESESERFPFNLLLVGGMHIEPARPLFSPWNETIAAAPHGVIVVSFGTLADTSAMPSLLAVALFDALSRLDGYRVFWRLAPRLILPGVGDVGTGANLTRSIPAHFNFTTYLPQNELLAQRRCRLLITNGGVHSVLEALTHGVPMLGLPLHGANRATLGLATRRGLAIVIEKTDADRPTLSSALRQLLDDARYLNAAQEASREVMRRPATALQRALHAIEAVARRGRLRRRTPSRSVAYVATAFWRVNGDVWLAITTFLALILILAYCISFIVIQLSRLLFAASGRSVRRFKSHAVVIKNNLLQKKNE